MEIVNFSKNPNLRFKLNICQTNSSKGIIDIFAIFVSYKDKKEYLISPNYMNYNWDIILLLDNKIKKSLKGHENDITTVRYFINPKNNKEYIISADYDFCILVWEIQNNFNKLHQLKSSSKLFSSLIIFPVEKDEDNKIFFIDYGVKVFSLENGERLDHNNFASQPFPNYLLEWYNKKNDKYHIINLNDNYIYITNLLDIKYAILKYGNGKYYSGFIYKENHKDILCNNKSGGEIQFWDLYDKALIQFISVGKGHLTKLIKWNEKYIISVNYLRNFIIIDISQKKAISNIGNGIKDINKINHPIYGESLIVATSKNKINLFVID